ncbi:hypothetical protein BT96DRAFT_291079, partial [Gymnopus androsaceus JB14]
MDINIGPILASLQSGSSGTSQQVTELRAAGTAILQNNNALGSSPADPCHLGLYLVRTPNRDYPPTTAIPTPVPVYGHSRWLKDSNYSGTIARYTSGKWTRFELSYNPTSRIQAYLYQGLPISGGPKPILEEDVEPVPRATSRAPSESRASQPPPRPPPRPSSRTSNRGYDRPPPRPSSRTSTRGCDRPPSRSSSRARSRCRSRSRSPVAPPRARGSSRTR